MSCWVRPFEAPLLQAPACPTSAPREQHDRAALTATRVSSEATHALQAACHGMPHPSGAWDGTAEQGHVVRRRTGSAPVAGARRVAAPERGLVLHEEGHRIARGRRLVAPLARLVQAEHLRTHDTLHEPGDRLLRLQIKSHKEEPDQSFNVSQLFLTNTPTDSPTSAADKVTQGRNRPVGQCITAIPHKIPTDRVDFENHSI